MPPISLAVTAEAPAGGPACAKPMSEPAPDGRRGRVAAACVFWLEATTSRSPLSTRAEEHGNCSAGLFTHGLAELGPSRDDVRALAGIGWVTPEMLPQIPPVPASPCAVTYGLLGEVPAGVVPDVVVARVNGRQLMVLADAIPGPPIEGEPRCHVVALAYEGRPAASVRCARSRAGTGMGPEEMTCALPARRLEQLTAAVEPAGVTDATAARYAGGDGRRLGP